MRKPPEWRIRNLATEEGTLARCDWIEINDQQYRIHEDVYFSGVPLGAMYRYTKGWRFVKKAKPPGFDTSRAFSIRKFDDVEIYKWKGDGLDWAVGNIELARSATLGNYVGEWKKLEDFVGCNYYSYAKNDSTLPDWDSPGLAASYVKPGNLPEPTLTYHIEYDKLTSITFNYPEGVPVGSLWNNRLAKVRAMVARALLDVPFKDTSEIPGGITPPLSLKETDELRAVLEWWRSIRSTPHQNDTGPKPV